MKTPKLLSHLLGLLLSVSVLQAATVEPAALAALQRMSTTLAQAKAFTYKTTGNVEVPSSTGQFLTLFPSTEVAVEKPGRMRARFRGEAPHFDFYYDGTTATAYAPGNNVYSVSKAPPTIEAMLPALEKETGIRLATAPLLFNNPYKTLTAGLTSGVVVGKLLIDGTECEHLAFRSPAANWEIWIPTGSPAVPRRLAVTFTDRPNCPRVVLQFSGWNLHPWLRAGDFVFRKPEGAKEIPFGSVLKKAR